jgi:hypothetical protein
VTVTSQRIINGPPLEVLVLDISLCESQIRQVFLTVKIGVLGLAVEAMLCLIAMMMISFSARVRFLSWGAMLEVFMFYVFWSHFFSVIVKTSIIRVNIEELGVERIIFVFHFLFLLLNPISEVISDLDRAKLERDVGVELESNLVLQLFLSKLKELLILDLYSENVEVSVDIWAIGFE